MKKKEYIIPENLNKTKIKMEYKPIQKETIQNK